MSIRFMMVVCILVALSLLSTTNALASANPLASSLKDTTWHLVEFQSMDDSVGIVRPQKSSLYSMTLNGDGTVNMQLNCNQGRGQWSAIPGENTNSGRFEISQLAVTRALCPPPSMDENLASQSQYIRSYFLQDDKLYLSLLADAGIYVWQQRRAHLIGDAVPLSSEQGGPINWEVATLSSGLNLRQQPSISSQVVLTFSNGQLLDNLGCHESDGRIWCYVQRFGGGPVGYVAAEHLKPAVSPNGAVINGPDDSALRAGRGKFDATGTIPCAQYSGQPFTECKFGVARTGGGYATVVVEKPDQVKRALFFRMGKASGADTSQADGYPEFRATKERDLHIIRVGDERYEIPDAVILGG